MRAEQVSKDAVIAEAEGVDPAHFLWCVRLCEFKKCCKKYKRGKRCKKCPKKEG